MNPRKILLAVFALVVFPTVVLAQETTNKLETVECFADGLYKFQSFQVSVGPELDTYKAGEKINFVGEIINENNYPVVDGNVFVRISKIKDSENINTIWHDVVDEFIAISDVSVNGSSTKPTNFSWQSPSSLGKGDYRADYFFSVDKRFNLGGLPFTNEIIIGTAYFAIENEIETIFELDRDNTKVNGAAYEHIGNWPDIEPNSAIVFSQPLKNLSNKEISVDVSYELYYWDSLRSEDKRDAKTEKITVPAKSSVVLSYTVDSAQEPVYYLKITAKHSGASSIVNLRTTSSIAKMRINYPAINNFPILKGEESTLFSCFHMTSYEAQNGKLVLTLTDKKDNVIASGEWTGEIDDYMNAAATKFTTDRDYSFVKLKAELFDENNKIVDQYETVYDCSIIGGTECLALNKTTAQTVVNYMEIGWILLVALIAILLTVRIKKLENNSPIRKALFTILVILILILVALVVKAAVLNTNLNDVVAETVSSNGKVKTETKTGYYSVTGFSGSRPITRGNLNVVHTVKLVPPASMNLQNSGSWKIPKGEDFSLTHSSSCSFTSAGGAWDTPVCGSAQTFGNYKSNRYGTVDFPSYNEPAKTVSSSSSTVVSCTGMNCTASDTGCSNITVKVNSFSKSPRACATFKNDKTSGVACTSRDIKVGSLTYDGSKQHISLSTSGATIGSYTTSAWKVCVYEDGACGSANGTNVNSQPTGTAACSAGTYNDHPGDTATEFKWRCLGENDGADIECSATKIINPACGSATGTIVSSQPTGTAACTTGNVEDETDTSTEFVWTCKSQTGVTEATCKATKMLNPVCGTTPLTCQSGISANPTTNDTQFLWNCVGIPSTNVANCSAPRTGAPVCGGINGTNYPQPTPGTTGACFSGVFRDRDDTTTQYLWSCVSDVGTTNERVVNCSSNKTLFNCGTANQTTVSSQPTGTAACSTGNVSSRSETSTTFNWVCSSSGETRTCYANKAPTQLNANCSVNDSSVRVGDSVTWTGSATGGSNSGYSYSWSGTVTGSGSTKTKTFGTSGNYSASVSVTDSANNTDSDSCPTVAVTRGGGTGTSDSPVEDNPPVVEIYYSEGPDGTKKPPVVPPGAQCTIAFTVPSVSASGYCWIRNALNERVNIDVDLEYVENQTDPITYLVNPQNSYTIICTDDPIDSDPGFEPTTSTSAALGCVLNPNIVEQ
jgi:hypothetical protein